MDSITNATSILDERNWVYFKLYKDPNLVNDWQSTLNWYHQTLLDVVKPVILNTSNIRVVFFGFYGPSAHGIENENYERQINPTATNLVFIRLRISMFKGNKNRVKNAFVAQIAQNGNLVWDYEVMKTYHVNNDLGPRYGNNVNSKTLQFIRYWDSACRYILSILDPTNNWIPDVDVWGIPHLVNNSLGATLRPERGPRVCQCGTHMYMRTWFQTLQPVNLQEQNFPLFVFECPNCGSQNIQPINI